MPDVDNSILRKTSNGKQVGLAYPPAISTASVAKEADSTWLHSHALASRPSRLRGNPYRKTPAQQKSAEYKNDIFIGPEDNHPTWPRPATLRRGLADFPDTRRWLRAGWQRIRRAYRLPNDNQEAPDKTRDIRPHSGLRISLYIASRQFSRSGEASPSPFPRRM